MIAFDLETELTAPRDTLGKVNLSPMVSPRLVLGGFADGSIRGEKVLMRDDCIACFRHLLENGEHLVGHNITGFDLNVLINEDPTLRPLVLEALDQGLLHDTSILYRLLHLALGSYDTPDPSQNFATRQLKYPSLAPIASELLQIDMDKGEDVRLTFGQYLGQPVSALSPRHRDYAIADVKVTLQVWCALEEYAIRTSNWSVIEAEPRETAAAWTLSQLDRRGIRIDQEEAVKLADRFTSDLAPLQTRLVEGGLGSWKPKPKSTDARKYQHTSGCAPPPMPWMLMLATEDRPASLQRRRIFKKHHYIDTATPEFHLSSRLVRERLEELPESKLMPRTEKTGQLSIKADDWAEYIDPDNGPLTAWLEHEKLKKILNTYLQLYRQTPRVYPRWHSLGARTGRNSASNPPTQQIPKRRHGIRSLFLADPGHILVRADYSYQELVTLAEIMHHLEIQGPLGEAIRAGVDPHIRTAALIAQKPEAEVTKAERQAAKACNFGFPGGLGPKKFASYAKKTYGVTLDPSQAYALRQEFFRVYPDIRAYLELRNRDMDTDLHNITGQGLREWRKKLRCRSARVLRDVLREHPNPELRAIHSALEFIHRVELPTGFVRGNASYTAACNTGFQGLAAAVTKRATFLAERAGLEVKLVVHDEIVIQVPKPRQSVAHRHTYPENAVFYERREALQCAMLQAFREVCPNFGPHAKVEVSPPSPRWGAATDGEGKEIK